MRSAHLCALKLCFTSSGPARLPAPSEESTVSVAACHPGKVVSIPVGGQLSLKGGSPRRSPSSLMIDSRLQTLCALSQPVSGLHGIGGSAPHHVPSGPRVQSLPKRLPLRVIWGKICTAVQKCKNPSTSSQEQTLFLHSTERARLRSAFKLCMLTFVWLEGAVVTALSHRCSLLQAESRQHQP